MFYCCSYDFGVLVLHHQKEVYYILNGVIGIKKQSEGFGDRSPWFTTSARNPLWLNVTHPADKSFGIPEKKKEDGFSENW